MIYLKRDIINEVVYTASELSNVAEEVSPDISKLFQLKLENKQTNVETTYDITDISDYPTRYNLSLIVLVDTEEEVIVGDTLYIVDLQTGYYDYSILDYYDTVVEQGTLLVELRASENVTYDPSSESKVYNPIKNN